MTARLARVVTPEVAQTHLTLLTAAARFDELSLQDALASMAEDDAAVGGQPLARDEALELLALSEVIARKAAYGRQLTVRSARAARASWTQNRRCSGHHQAIRVGGPQPVDRPAGKPPQCIR